MEVPPQQAAPRRGKGRVVGFDRFGFGGGALGVGGVGYLRRPYICIFGIDMPFGIRLAICFTLKTSLPSPTHLSASFGDNPLIVFPSRRFSANRLRFVAARFFSPFLLLRILSSLADSGGAFFRKSVVPDTLPLSPRTPPGPGASEPRQEACLLRSFRFDYLLLPLSRLCSDYLSLPGSSTAGPTACRKSS